MTYIENLHGRLESLGCEIHPRGLIGFKVAENSAMLMPIDSTLSEPIPQDRVSEAVIGVGLYARAADEIMRDELRSGLGKDRAMRELTAPLADRLNTLLIEAGDALVFAEREAAKETAPLPIDAADAAQAVVDGELRGLLRALAPAEAMERVRADYASLKALLRVPVGFDAQLVSFAETVWQEANPRAPTSHPASRLAASWREARRVIGECIAVLTLLSNGRLPATLPAAA